jgi:hypothetical protein
MDRKGERGSGLVKRLRLAAGVLAGVASLAVVGLASTPASAAPAIANGEAAYSPGTTSPPNQFNVLTLVSGGSSSVNPSSLTIVNQPSSGSAIVTTATASSGLITYTPASDTSGTQTLTFAYCAPGTTYPSVGNCATATLTYTASTDQYFGGDVDNLSGVIEDLQTAVTVPSTATQGSTVDMSVAPVATSVPSSDDGIGVNYAGQFSLVMPVPTGFSYVPGSLTVTGGDATTSGNFTATYCTGPVSDACTAQIDNGNYKTVYPYIETYLNPATTIAGGDNVTLPTVSAQFTASGTPGSVVPVLYTEFVLVTNVQDIGSLTFDGYPSCSSCASGVNPTYSPPVAQASTTITSSGLPTVTSVSPTSGATSGGTSVTITGTNLSGATAVHFGPSDGTITNDSATSVTATSPSGTGTVDVTVTTPNGTSATSSADQFTYSATPLPPTVTSVSPTSGATSGGTSVTITGTNLSGATAVHFGPSDGTITNDSATSVTATSPAGTGTVDVSVSTPAGISTPVAADQFSFGSEVETELSSWSDTQACGIQSTATVPSSANSVSATLNGGPGGGGGGAASSDSGGGGGGASTAGASFAVTPGEQLTAIAGCSGASAPSGSGVVSTGGAGGLGYSNGGSGGNGYYCAGINVDGDCIGDSGADGSGGGGGGSSAVCVGASCQVGITPLIVAGGGGGGGESMCAGSDGGGGGTGGGGSSTSSVDLTGAGNSGTDGGQGATSGDVGGAGGVNNTGDSPGGTPGGEGSTTVSAGDSAGNGGGGGGYVGGQGSTATAGVDCGAGGGGGGGSSWAVDGSGATFGTTSDAAGVSLTFYGFVGSSPSVTAQPSSATVDVGQPVSFAAGASGNPYPQVQWQVSTDGGSSFSDIVGANSTTLQVTAAATDSGNEYRAVFTNSVGTVTTSAATLTVDTPPAVTLQPVNQTVLQGSSVTFTAAASGSPTPTVQWQVSTDGGTAFAPISGADGTTLTFTTAPGESGNEYEAVFTNAAGSVTTPAATLTLDTVPVVTVPPSSVSVIIGKSASFTAAASGNPTPTVQWQVSTNGGVTFTNIAGATSPTYSLTPALTASGEEFRAVFTNAAGTATSSPATLTVTMPPPLSIATTSLPNGSVYNHKLKNVYSATLSASGGNPPYKWSIVAGTLPTGLKLAKSTGLIHGNATFPGTFTFTVEAVDTKTKTKPPTQRTATAVLSITINS